MTRPAFSRPQKGAPERRADAAARRPYPMKSWQSV